MTIQKFLNYLDNIEPIGAEIASKLALWLAPLLSAIIVSQAVLQPPFNWEMWQAILLGSTLELMGIAVLSTSMLLYSHRSRQPANRKPSLLPLFLSTVSVAVYAATVAIITVALKWPDLMAYANYISPLVYVGVLLLAITSAVNLTLRRDHFRLVNQPNAPGSRRKPAGRKRPGEQTNEERLANLETANATRRPTATDYNRAAQLRASGLTWPEVATKIDRSVSTAKNWAGQNGREED